MNTVTLKVKGMTCMGCVRSVKVLLSTLPGVDHVDVDLASGCVMVTHAPERTSLETLRNAIRDGGYSVED